MKLLMLDMTFVESSGDSRFLQWQSGTSRLLERCDEVAAALDIGVSWRFDNHSTALVLLIDVQKWHPPTDIALAYIVRMYAIAITYPPSEAVKPRSLEKISALL